MHSEMAIFFRQKSFPVLYEMLFCHWITASKDWQTLGTTKTETNCEYLGLSDTVVLNYFSVCVGFTIPSSSFYARYDIPSVFPPIIYVLHKNIYRLVLGHFTSCSHLFFIKHPKQISKFFSYGIFYWFSN